MPKWQLKISDGMQRTDLHANEWQGQLVRRNAGADDLGVCALPKQVKQTAWVLFAQLLSRLTREGTAD